MACLDNGSSRPDKARQEGARYSRSNGGRLRTARNRISRWVSYKRSKLPFMTEVNSMKRRGISCPTRASWRWAFMALSRSN